jgi:cell division protein FtsI (penicillin-binding protein 3)
MLSVMTLACGAITTKLLILQSSSSMRYQLAAQSELVHTVDLPAARGAIMDRTGQDLALSVNQTTIYADPHFVGNPVAEAKALAPILDPVTHETRRQIQSELEEKNGFVYLARTVGDATAAKVERLGEQGVSEMSEPKRFYPSGSLASPLLGLAGTDDTGLSGLEYEYNRLLGGRAGRLVEELDPTGREIAGGQRDYKKAVAGDDLVLTIDSSLQYDEDQNLARAIVASHAGGGIAMTMDTNTGDILAVSSEVMPDKAAGIVSTKADQVVPAEPGLSEADEPVEAPSEAAFTSVYEPGSINKLITISAALQDHVVVPTDEFVIPNTYDVAGTTFHDAETHPTENWNVTEILANSSNIGTIQIGQRLGKDRLVKVLHDYGLGEKTDINFPGESAGLILNPADWSGTSIATIAFGQGIAVTAAQMLAAYNTIANGGMYVAPRLVDGVINAQGRFERAPASAHHRVVSPLVAQQMTTMLEQVVKVGTGTGAAINGYTVAGKTGTALVPSVSGGYQAGHYFASFAGFVPAEKPAITSIVMLDNTPDFGGDYSAPTFASIAQYALREFQIPPQAPRPPAPGVPLVASSVATAASPSAATSQAPDPSAAVPVQHPVSRPKPHPVAKAAGKPKAGVSPSSIPARTTSTTPVTPVVPTTATTPTTPTTPTTVAAVSGKT